MRRFVQIFMACLVFQISFADIYIPLGTNHTITLNKGESHLVLLAPKPDKRYDCKFTASRHTHQKYLRISSDEGRVATQTLQIMQQDGLQLVIVPPEKAPANHKQYYLRLHNSQHHAITLDVNCGGSIKKKSRRASKRGKRTHKNADTNGDRHVDKSDSLLSIEALLVQVQAESRITDYEKFSAYLAALHSFDSKRDEPDIKLVYQKVWDKLISYTSASVLDGKNKVAIPSRRQDNYHVLAIMIDHPAELQLIRAHPKWLSQSFLIDPSRLESRLNGPNMDMSCTQYWHQGRGFKPIGSQKHPFCGEFYVGENCVLNGLVIDNQTRANPTNQGSLFDVIGENAYVSSYRRR